MKSKDRNEGTTEFTKVIIKPEHEAAVLVTPTNATTKKKVKVPHDEEDKEH